MVMDIRPLRLVLATVSLLVLLNSHLGQAQTPAPAPLTPGQTLTYDLYWSIFPAGGALVRFAILGRLVRLNPSGSTRAG